MKNEYAQVHFDPLVRMGDEQIPSGEEATSVGLQNGQVSIVSLTFWPYHQHESQWGSGATHREEAPTLEQSDS